MSNPLAPVKWHEIQDVQLEITRWADEQFPGRTDHQTIYKLVVHEIPELMVHKKEKGTAGIGTELADCFILLMDLASMWGVDLSEAIRAKMEINYQRVWERDAHGIMQHIPIQAEPVRVDLVYCPYCRSCSHTIPVTPDAPVPTKGSTPNDTHICTRCDMSFDDSIPF